MCWRLGALSHYVAIWLCTSHLHVALWLTRGGCDNKMVLAILYPVFVLDKKVFNPSRWNNVQRQGNLFLCLFSQVNALF